jgi:hypothetical protein
VVFLEAAARLGAVAPGGATRAAPKALELLLCDLKISAFSAQKFSRSASTCGAARPRSRSFRYRSLLKQSRLPEAGLSPNYAGSCQVAHDFNACGACPGHDDKGTGATPANLFSGRILL